MRLSLILLLGTSAWATDSLTVYEKDGVTQTLRPISFGRYFVDGEIPSGKCPQPLISGVGAATWQADTKNFYPSGALKYAVISYIGTLSSGGTNAVTFASVNQSNGFCNSSGASGLTYLQMKNFNAGGGAGVWDAQIVVTANGTTVTTSAATMLTNDGDPTLNTFCNSDVWLSGPVVTQVRIRDCTSTSVDAFGWTWNGTTMSSPTGASHTATTASLMPTFYLSFYPTISAIKVDYILENDFTNRRQDQQYSLSLTSGLGSQTQWYSKALFTHVANSRWRKTNWIGTNPGNFLIAHNFAYLISAKAFLNYDLTQSVDPESSESGAASYATWAAGDRGDIMGTSSMCSSWSSGCDYGGNNEGAPLQREDLELLYNMDTDCGVADVGGTHSKCARAFQKLTGLSGAANTNLTTNNVVGGGGFWATTGHMNYHLRESRTAGGNAFYCPSWDGTNVTHASACGASGGYTGRVYSRDAFPSNQFLSNWTSYVANVGTVGASTWTLDIAHWQDYAYAAYLLTGDPYYMEEEEFGGSKILADVNSNSGQWNSYDWFAFISTSYYKLLRQFAWGIQSVGRAGMVAPDGTQEASYFQAKTKLNLEIEEGVMGLTGTSLTPTSPNITCAGYAVGTATPWDWGHCTAAGGVTPALHAMTTGQCPIGSSVYVQSTQATDAQSEWWHPFAAISLNGLKDIGYSQASAIVTDQAKRIVEEVEEGEAGTFNPWLVAAYEIGLRNGVGSCNTALGGSVGVTANAFFTQWSQVKASAVASVQTQATFDHGSGTPWENYPCSDHGYSLIARASATFASGTNSVDTNCSGGTCLGSLAWLWMNTHTPYFNKVVTGSASCSGNIHIKFALGPRTTAGGSNKSGNAIINGNVVIK